jgi:hypothetical protein
VTSRRVVLLTLLVVGCAGLVALLFWDPYPDSQRSFDRGRNGIWLGHRWYTGRDVNTDAPVSPSEITEMTAQFARHGIRYAYVHVGPALADGSLEDRAGEIFHALREAAPDVTFLAWVGARVDKVELDDPKFRATLIDFLRGLHAEGFPGVHFDFEPLPDGDAGYLDLLRSVRRELGEDFFISQATPRAGPFGWSTGPLRRSFWSEDYYLATIGASDQTVVMAYDSGLSFTKAYVEFVRHQTSLLSEWACGTNEHELLIGVPSYEDVPTYSDPQVENLRTAALGVRAALEGQPALPSCFAGVAIYSYWVTDADEWRDFRRYWMAPGEVMAD